jgi:hypothetical protein
MQCRQCRGLLSAFLDSELCQEEMWQVRTHLDLCCPCQSEFRSLKETKCALASLGARVSRDDIDRLLQTDVGEAARRIASMPVSPRTVTAAFLSLFGVWLVSTRLTTHDDRTGVPLPDGAYRQLPPVLLVSECSSCSLVAVPSHVTQTTSVYEIAPSMLPTPVPEFPASFNSNAPARSTRRTFFVQTSIQFQYRQIQ